MAYGRNGSYLLSFKTLSRIIVKTLKGSPYRTATLRKVKRLIRTNHSKEIKFMIVNWHTLIWDCLGSVSGTIMEYMLISATSLIVSLTVFMQTIAIDWLRNQCHSH